MIEIKSCGLTSRPSEFKSLMKLPNFPLTEAFGDYEIDFPKYEQELVMCMNSGHVQLKFQLDSTILYNTKNYKFRTGDSNKSNREIDFLLNFIKTVSEDNFSEILEIGANDLKLSRILQDRCEKITACDPLLVENHGRIIEGIHIVGQTIEVALKEKGFSPPDLVIARHTLEHISSPKRMIETLFESTKEECIFIFEVPSLMHIAESLRFDAVFHQHYHYFDLPSVNRLMLEVGGKLLNHTYNNQGSNGGSLLFAFKRAKSAIEIPMSTINTKYEFLEKRISLFMNQMQITQQILNDIQGPTFGYGAGLMVASLNYHLKGGVEVLNLILDDDEDKHGIGYKNLDIQVVSTSRFEPPEQSNFLITSLENIRPIYNRITKLNPKRIIAPIIT